jgi:hypothetical protein
VDFFFKKKDLGEDGKVKDDILAGETAALDSETERSVTAPKLHYYLREYKEIIIYLETLFALIQSAQTQCVCVQTPGSPPPDERK